MVTVADKKAHTSKDVPTTRINMEKLCSMCYDVDCVCKECKKSQGRFCEDACLYNSKNITCVGFKEKGAI